MTTTKRPRGRPALPDAERVETWSLRIPAPLRAAVEAAAREAGVSPAEWARRALSHAVTGN
jgi:predicted HicB family RNase H-like nuclease